jgi:hypothetical protein
MSPLFQRLATLGAVLFFGAGSVACAHPQQVPGGTLTVSRPAAPPEGAPDEAKTVRVEYALRNDAIDRDFTKSFKDGFSKKGLKVDEKIDARAHFDVKDAKIVGTVTYVKKGMGHYSILSAELEAIGHYDADVQLDVDVQAKGDTTKANEGDWAGTSVGGKPFELAKNIMPTNIPVAGPLFLHVHFDLTAACALEVEGQMHATAGVGVRGDVHLSAKYKKDGFVREDGKKSRFQFDHSAPNFELAPRPYLTVTGKQQRLHGKCSLQPTAVLLLEHSVGAKLSVEPFLELDAQRASNRAPWKLDAQAGVSVHAATDLEVFGRQIGKPLEFELAKIMLTKPGDDLGVPPPAAPPKESAPPAVLASNMMLPMKAVPLSAKTRPSFSLPWKKKR